MKRPCPFNHTNGNSLKKAADMIDLDETFRKTVQDVAKIWRRPEKILIENTLNQLFDGSKMYFANNQQNEDASQNCRCRNCFRSSSYDHVSSCALCERLLCHLCLANCDKCQSAVCFLCSEIKYEERIEIRKCSRCSV